ncbi:MAG: DNA polymerase III subunit delta' [Candidatus Omnitrophota bacterium]|jgi:DNA polymerase-3 subunit delta'
MSFRDIKGQDTSIGIIREYISNSRFTGSYLFSGEEGVGKMFTARTLAKALNCEKEGTDSCDRCASCLKIEKGEHPDVHIIGSEEEGASDAVKIEYIRRLQKEASLRPYEGKRKVFIVDNAHNLTSDAANALLKVLEEPPEHTLIILVSAKPALLFKTIVSRCKTIKFYPLKRTLLEQVLKKDFRIDDTLSHYLAYFCEGRIGRALSLKETDILKDKNRVIDALALADRRRGTEFTADSRDSVKDSLNILAGWFRDIYMVKIGTSYSELINLDRKDDLLRVMNRYAFTDLYEIMNSISGSFFYLDRNVNTKLLLSNLKWALKNGA